MATGIQFRNNDFLHEKWLLYNVLQILYVNLVEIQIKTKVNGVEIKWNVIAISPNGW